MVSAVTFKNGNILLVYKLEPSPEASENVAKLIKTIRKYTPVPITQVSKLCLNHQKIHSQATMLSYKLTIFVILLATSMNTRKMLGMQLANMLCYLASTFTLRDIKSNWYGLDAVTVSLWRHCASKN